MWRIPWRKSGISPCHKASFSVISPCRTRSSVARSRQYYSIVSVTLSTTRTDGSKPASPRSLRGEVLDDLSAAIVTGELEPGDLVTVPTLAERYEVSATPVREALLELEQRGFVVAVRNKGYRVTEVGEQDLVEVVELRRMLEVPAVRKAALLFPVDQAEHFATLAAAIVGYASQGDLPRYLAADWRFHKAVLDLAGNERLVKIVAGLRQQTRMVGLRNIVGTEHLDRSALEHQTMVDLLVAGEGDALAALVHDHIGHVLGWWSGRAEES